MIVLENKPMFDFLLRLHRNAEGDVFFNRGIPECK